MWPRRYAEDMERAWNQVRAVASEQIQTPSGRLEYAQQGEGLPVLMSHGIWGCHAEGIEMVSTYLGSGYRAIAPSRFGYSAGSASAIQLALRHPDRLHALILIAAHLPGLPTPPRLVHPVLRLST